MTAPATSPIRRHSDTELTRAAVSGDKRAFAMIYDRYSNRLYDFCVGMLANRDSAADCVQDVFCTAATQLPQLRDPDRLRPWLYAIARNEALRRIRDRRREVPTDEVPDTASAEPGPEALAARLELSDLIEEAACGLSDRDRAVLELAFRHGLNGPDLADILGVTPANANTIVHRLRQNVERALGALLVSRRVRAGGGCDELAAILDGWDGTFNMLDAQTHFASHRRVRGLRRAAPTTRQPGRPAGCGTGVHPGAGMAARTDAQRGPADLFERAAEAGTNR